MKSKHGTLEKATLVLIVATLVVVAFNTMQIHGIKTTGAVTNGKTLTGPVSGATSITVVPAGIPEIYGAELGVNYDDVSPTDPRKADITIQTLAMLDQNIELEGDDLDRYINIASQISCEYCCGAQSIIFSNGEAACGCAHSYAMRGLAKYLITEHGDEYTDSEILEELGKWKTLFFPSQITAKAKILQEQGIETNYINLASNKYRGIEKGVAGSGMVGGC